MEKTSRVTSVQGNGTFTTDHGTFYKWEVAMENGDAGQYNSKTETQTKFIVGQEAKYDITSKEFNGNTYYTIKPVYENTGGGSKWKADPLKDARITRMSVLKAAVELCATGQIKKDDVLKTAIAFEAWVNKAVAMPEPGKEQPKITEPTKSIVDDKDTDLPF